MAGKGCKARGGAPSGKRYEGRRHGGGGGGKNKRRRMSAQKVEKTFETIERRRGEDEIASQVDDMRVHEKVQAVVDMYATVAKLGMPAPHDVVAAYKDMANGGDGGRLRLGEGSPGHGMTCREFNYPGWLDSDFQEVIDTLGW